MYILALCILAKDFRLLRTGEPPLVSFEKCLLCAQKAKKVYDWIIKYGMKKIEVFRKNFHRDSKCL